MAIQYTITGTGSSDISASIESGVRDGHLNPGDTLPAVRKLADQLGVSPGTVASAYRDLRQRGIVETGGRSGTTIRRQTAYTPSGTLSVPTGILDLASGEPDNALLPDLAPLLQNISLCHVNYRDGGPCPTLLDVARERLMSDLITGELTVTSGALDAMERALGVHLRPGDTVAVEQPTWPNSRNLLLSAGYNVTTFDIDRDGPIASQVNRVLKGGTRAIIMTSRGHNPTGVSISHERSIELAAVLERHQGVFVIEDDHWGDLSSTPLHTITGITDHWLYIRSASKAYGPDLRLAIAASDALTQTRITTRMSVGHGWVSTILQHLVLAAWEDPDISSQIANVGIEYARRQTALREALAAYDIHPWGQSGLNLWIPVANETNTTIALREKGIAVSPGFNYTQGRSQAIRVATGTLDPADAPRIAAAIAEAAQPTTLNYGT